MIKIYKTLSQPKSLSIIYIFKLIYVLFILSRNIVLKFILFFFSYIIPKKNNILLFSSVGNYDFPLFFDEPEYQIKESPKYLSIYAANNFTNSKIYYHCPNRKLFSKIKSKNIIPIKGIKSLWIMLRANYIFVDNNNFLTPNPSFLIGRFNSIQCFHGTPLKDIESNISKKLSFYNNLKKIEKSKYKYYLSTCEHTTKIFKKAFNNENVFITGFPRNDILFNYDFFKMDDYDRKFSLNNYNKVILFAPTYREIGKEYNPFTEIEWTNINKSLQKNKSILLIKQHPYSKNITFNNNYDSILDITYSCKDIQELLPSVSILITDFSSVFFDYSLLDREIILFALDYDEYINNTGLVIDTNHLHNLTVIKEKNEFFSHFEESLKNNRSIEISKFKSMYNTFTDGNSCKRTFELINYNDPTKG